MIANRLTSVSLAIALSAAFASAAVARDRGPHHAPGYHGHHHGHHYGRNRLRILSDGALGGASRVATVKRNVRSNAGSVTSPGSYSVAVGSTVFYSDGYRAIYLDQRGLAAERPALSYPAPKAKIIHVTEELAGGSFRPTDGCSYEMGVCVIRGGN
jgi:hypothetical protein